MWNSDLTRTDVPGLDMALIDLYLGLGSNLGDRRENLLDAIGRLERAFGKECDRVSSFIETEPWGFESEHPFLNAAVRLATVLTPRQLLLVTQEIERELGRTAKSSDGIYHDRVIDIDILTYDDVELDETFLHEGRTLTLHIPHPLMKERDFVMVPLRQIWFDL